ncbi:hypothetical protein TNCT_5191 [Trichonephila clavata]|uniref:Uncharacterized protein n=1 Tax=Trichonephila clavata TaxID=2740835 RepID=A0A8X6G2A6_TRICU|nr:hypothetical protein TNCT_5191 [Trichonephila clavata]
MYPHGKEHKTAMSPSEKEATMECRNCLELDTEMFRKTSKKISVHFSFKSFTVDRPVFLWYKIFLKDTQGSRLYCIHRKGSFASDGTWLGNKSFDFEMLPDEFVLECQIEVSDDAYISQVGTTIDDSSPDWKFDSRYLFSTYQLSKDMNRLLESRKFSDTIIRCKNKKNFDTPSNSGG